MKNKSLKLILIILSIAFVLLFIFAVYEGLIIAKTTSAAHKTFDGYCNWRGLEIVNKTVDYGYCRDADSNKIYKMVLFKGKWYLDGDLPWFS